MAPIQDDESKLEMEKESDKEMQSLQSSYKPNTILNQQVAELKKEKLAHVYNELAATSQAASGSVGWLADRCLEIKKTFDPAGEYLHLNSADIGGYERKEDYEPLKLESANKKEEEENLKKLRKQAEYLLKIVDANILDGQQVNADIYQAILTCRDKPDEELLEQLQGIPIRNIMATLETNSKQTEDVKTSKASQVVNLQHFEKAYAKDQKAFKYMPFGRLKHYYDTMSEVQKTLDELNEMEKLVDPTDEKAVVDLGNEIRKRSQEYSKVKKEIKNIERTLQEVSNKILLEDVKTLNPDEEKRLEAFIQGTFLGLPQNR